MNNKGSKSYRLNSIRIIIISILILEEYLLDKNTYNLEKVC